MTEDRFTTGVFDKIRETLIDLQFLATMLEVESSDLIDYFSVVRCLNGFVYALDGFVESHQTATTNYTDNTNTLAETFLGFASALIGRGDRFQQIQTWTLRHGQYGLQEIYAEHSMRTGKPYVDRYFRDLFEESSHEYIDTGFYGRLLLDIFAPPTIDIGSVLAIWNVRCKTLDLIDGLVDLNEDVASGNPGPLALYIYSVATPEEREIISETFSSGKHWSQCERLFNDYSARLLALYKEPFICEEDDLLCVGLRKRTRRIIEITERSLGESSLSSLIADFYMNEPINIYSLEALTEW